MHFSGGSMTAALILALLATSPLTAQARTGRSAAKGRKPPSKVEQAPPPPVADLPMPPPPAPPAPREEPLKVAAIGLSAINLPEKFSSFYTEHLAQQMAGWGARMTTPKEIQALLGFERQKQLLGCSDEGTSCLTELGNALGVDGLLLGDLARVGKDFQLNAKVVAAADGALLSSYSERVDDESKLLDAFNRAGRKLTVDAAEKLKKKLPPPSKEFLAGMGKVNALEALKLYETPLRPLAWIPLAAGALAAGGGAFFLVQADAQYRELTSTSGLIEEPRARALRDGGMQAQTLGWTGVGIGAAGLVISAGMFLWAREVVDSPRVAIVPGPSGFGVAGVFP